MNLQRKNAHNFQNLRFIPTFKIKQILDSNHITGIDGRDYHPVKEELEQILWERQNRSDAHKLTSLLEEQELLQDYLDSLPPSFDYIYCHKEDIYIPCPSVIETALPF